MALVDSGKAIGAVTKALAARLRGSSGERIVSVGRPDESGGSDLRLNLFLYEALFDPGLKNTPLDEGQPPPLWLVLKYLLTAHDGGGESNTEDALDLLGEGARVLQQLNSLSLTGLDEDIVRALADNPEDLRITFDEASADLISKVMQGTDEKYRLALAFQVRPVMIATGEPQSYSLLVGVNYEQTPPEIIGERGRNLEVFPLLGPSLEELSPPSFELNDVLTLRGASLDLPNLSVMLGTVELPVIAQRPDQLQCRVDADLASAAKLSAGSHAVTVVQTRSGGRRRSSNLLVGDLLPTLTAVSVVPPVSAVTPLPDSPVFASIELTGKLLGKTAGEQTDDDVVVALYRNGRTIAVFDVLTGPTEPPQDQKRLAMREQDAVERGEYLLILHVNGQQARRSLPVNFAP